MRSCMRPAQSPGVTKSCRISRIPACSTASKRSPKACARCVRDAVVLTKKIAAKLTALDLLCVWVTFIDELASLGDQTVSMVSTVVRENPALRTYKIIRRPADGLAYAMSIAEKYGLTYAMIKERIGS
jgi:hypothetical protein